MKKDSIPKMPPEDFESAENARTLLVLRPVLSFERLSEELKNELAAELSISRSTLRRKINRLREMPVASALQQKTPGPANGSRYLSKEVVQICTNVISDYYLCPEKPSIKATHNQVIFHCVKNDLEPPSYSTLRRMVQAVPRKKLLTARLGSKIYKNQNSPATKHYQVERPMQVVQIDHTIVNTISVCSIDREEIGRAIMTVAIDVCTRMIVGIFFSLSGPSCENVSEVMARMAFPSNHDGTTEGEGLPCLGLPESIHLDNAKEFRSTATSRGTSEHGIDLIYRPIGGAHYGGHVERAIGTILRKIEEYPGTTFANIKERAGYDSQKRAILTLEELETLVLTFIRDVYHKTVHRGLGMSPLAKLNEGIENGFVPRRPCKDEEAFRADFMNQFNRAVRREGIEYGRVFYWSGSIQAWYDRGIKKIRVIPLEADVTRIIVIGPDGTVEIAFSKDQTLPKITRSEFTRHRKKLQEKNSHFAITNAEIAAYVGKENQRIVEAKRKTRFQRRAAERTGIGIQASNFQDKIIEPPVSMIGTASKPILPARLKVSGNCAPKQVKVRGVYPVQRPYFDPAD